MILAGTSMQRFVAMLVLGLGLVLLAAPHASAAPQRDYEFQGTLASSTGAANNLTQLGPGATQFTTATVGGLSRQVLNFPQGNGFEANISPAYVTTIIDFRLDNVSGYRRLIDIDGNSSDNGLYVHDGKLNFFSGGSHETSTPVIPANTYVEVALSTYCAMGCVSLDNFVADKMYVNGQQVGPAAVSDNASFSGAGAPQIIRFFKDSDVGNPGEESGGSVACIRISDSLTPAEVAAAYNNGACPVNPAQPAPPAGSTAALPTGKRAAALKKCKKKHGRAKRRCIRHAKHQPV